MTKTEITIRKPDDWHLHVRDGELLGETVPATARCFARAIIMPNLVPPIVNAQMARAYRDRILAAVPKGQQFEPLMTIYLTDMTTPEIIAEAKASGVVAAKLYPAGATTNSAAAVTRLDGLEPVFKSMADVGMLLLVHGEVTDADIDIFDRERVFIDTKLRPLIERHPDLKVVLEHVTTKDGIDFVLQSSENVAATITPQHLLLNRNDLLVGGLRPHNYCLPVLKRQTHQQALRAAVASGSPKIFLGSDSAPHARDRKESACGCAGCYSAWSAIELYAEIFEQLGALEHFEAFASLHGPRFYGLACNEETITLRRQPWKIPEKITLSSGGELVPFFAGQTVQWQVVAATD